MTMTYETRLNSYTVSYRDGDYYAAIQVAARTMDEAIFIAQKNFKGCERVTSVVQN